MLKMFFSCSCSSALIMNDPEFCYTFLFLASCSTMWFNLVKCSWKSVLWHNMSGINHSFMIITMLQGGWIFSTNIAQTVFQMQQDQIFIRNYRFEPNMEIPSHKQINMSTTNNKKKLNSWNFLNKNQIWKIGNQGELSKQVIL